MATEVRCPAVNVLKICLQPIDSLIGLRTAVSTQLERNNTVLNPCKHFKEILFNKSLSNWHTNNQYTAWVLQGLWWGEQQAVNVVAGRVPLRSLIVCLRCFDIYFYTAWLSTSWKMRIVNQDDMFIWAGDRQPPGPETGHTNKGRKSPKKTPEGWEVLKITLQTGS